MILSDVDPLVVMRFLDLLYVMRPCVNKFKDLKSCVKAFRSTPRVPADKKLTPRVVEFLSGQTVKDLWDHIKDKKP